MAENLDNFLGPLITTRDVTELDRKPDSLIVTRRVNDAVTNTTDLTNVIGFSLSPSNAMITSLGLPGGHIYHQWPSQQYAVTT